MVTAAAAVWLAAGSAAQAAEYAVFNFQMKSQTPEWRWLEKGLSDRITTDFCQHQGLTVVARDEMQLLAQRMSWVPEMAADAKAAGSIRQHLRIQRIVTGVFSIDGDVLDIKAQVVDVASRKEVLRKEISGRLIDTLDLQRQLSAQLIGALLNKSSDQVLKDLPVWTRSLPAARCLYEGMDLYDQGRYAEAWLQFRQARREDAGYVEAVYWVGKMYYFLGRYEHARRSLEQFVYLDATHPRLKDALLEYVHTYEVSDAGPAELVALYRRLRERFPERPSFHRLDWLGERQSLMLCQDGRFLEALELRYPVFVETSGFADVCSAVVLGLADHLATTDRLPPLDRLLKTEVPRVRDSIFKLSAPLTEREIMHPVPVRLASLARRQADREALTATSRVDQTFVIVVPRGHAIRRLTLKPLVDGDAAMVEADLCLFGQDRAIPLSQRRMTLADAKRAGVEFTSLPLVPMFRLSYHLVVPYEEKRTGVAHGLVVRAELEPAESSTALDVDCASTCDCYVEVDGRFGRWGPGLVGPLAAGQHRVVVRPTDTNYGEVAINVTAVTGTVVKVGCSLPWAEASGWSQWSVCRLAPPYPSVRFSEPDRDQRPALLLEDREIRAIWAYDGDLWTAASSDGKTFTSPSKLDLPVSTGWVETTPRLLRDESGRRILLFMSNRDSQHRNMLYICWSRDGTHWSAPSMISEVSDVADFAACIDGQGRLLLATSHNWSNKLTVHVSEDGIRWTKTKDLKPSLPRVNTLQPNVVCRDDGMVELFVYESYRDATPDPSISTYGQIVRHRLLDGSSTPYVLRKFSRDDLFDGFGACHFRGRTTLLCGQGKLRILAEQRDDTWLEGRVCAGATGGPATWSEDATWGKVIVWYATHPILYQATQRPFGPVVLRGQEWPASLAPTSLPSEPSTAPASSPPAGRYGGTCTWGADGGLEAVNLSRSDMKEVVVIDLLPGVPPAATQPAFPKRHGEICYYASQRGSTAGPRVAPAPVRGPGIVSRHAVSARYKLRDFTISLAFDGVDESSSLLQVLRVDLTGKDDFARAPSLLLQRIDYSRNTQEIGYFSHVVLSTPEGIPFLARVFMVEVGPPEKPPATRYVQVGAQLAGMTKCIFAGKEHDVYILDDNGNLKLDDGDWVQAENQAELPLPLLLENQLWSFTLSEGGKRLEPVPYKEKHGWIRVNNNMWSLRLKSNGRYMHVGGGREAVPCAIGSFEIVGFTESIAVGRNPAPYVLRCGGGSLEVAVDKTTELQIGSPVTPRLTATVEGQSVRFAYSRHEVGNRTVWIEWPGRKGGEYTDPIITVREASGRPVVKLHAELTHKEDWQVTWQAPADLSGTFTATAEENAGPFIPTPPKTTFTIK
jgi:TolB-like protein